MHTCIRPLAAALLAVGLAATLLPADPAHAAPQAEAAAPADPAARDLYWNGHEALAEGDWEQALERFRRLERQLREAGGSGVDGALYWQAYALHAAKRERQAGRVAEQLEREFPDSRWRAEAAKFRTVTVNPGAAAASPDRQREADALMALDALMLSDSRKALPTLQRVLASDHSDKVKTRALFVLSQIDAEAASAALDQVLSRPGSSSRLKREAVQQIAIGGNARSLERLVELYPQSDADVRRGILNAYMIAGRGDLLGRVARSETDPKLQRKAIQLLGASGDSSALVALYGELTEPRARRSAIQALGIAGDSAALERILDGASDAEVQSAALQALGIAGTRNGARGAIVKAYRNAASPKVRDAAVHALLVAGDADSLLALYREETDRERKQALLRALTMTDSDRALELIDEQL